MADSHEVRLRRARIALEGLSVGGIVASYTGIERIPKEWIENREPLPAWAFEKKSS